MTTLYTGTASNVTAQLGAKLGTLQPIDGDVVTAAEWTVALQKMQDQIEFLHETLISQAVTTWFKQAPFAAAESFVIWSNGSSSSPQFVAVGNGDGTSAHIWRSPDGYNWTVSLTVAAPTNFRGAAWNGSLWVAAGGGSATQIYTSPDGATWTARTAISMLTGRCVAWGANIWVVVCDSGIQSSPDGITWTSRSAVSNFQYVIFANGLFVASTTGSTIYTSPDGITWTSRAPGVISAITAMAYANGLYVAVDNAGHVATSPDAITWTLRFTSSGTVSSGSIAWTGKFFAAILGFNIVAFSMDGVTWTSKSAGTQYSALSPSNLVAHPSSGMLFTAGAGIVTNSLASPLP